MPSSSTHSTSLVRLAPALDPGGNVIAPLHLMHWRHGHAYRTTDEPVGGAAKRIFDATLAGLALLALSPLLLILCILIRLESPGPAIFRQWRAGFRGRAFRIYKLRSMRTRNSGRNIVQARRADPRVTPLGRFLRRTSLDELPQLINVLKGDMSLVGPRPHAIAHEYEFGASDRDYAMRRTARPGITGLAQICGARGLTDTPEKVARRLKFDLTYIEQWSFALDLLIIVRTVAVVFRDRAAF